MGLTCALNAGMGPSSQDRGRFPAGARPDEAERWLCRLLRVLSRGRGRGAAPRAAEPRAAARCGPLRGGGRGGGTAWLGTVSEARVQPQANAQNRPVLKQKEIPTQHIQCKTQEKMAKKSFSAEKG